MIEQGRYYKITFPNVKWPMEVLVTKTTGDLNNRAYTCIMVNRDKLARHDWVTALYDQGNSQGNNAVATADIKAMNLIEIKFFKKKLFMFGRNH